MAPFAKRDGAAGLREVAHFAVIGAGLAGLTAAAVLKQAGHRVAVFDKSRGLGGRLATRRRGDGAFDHGAPRAQGGAAFDAAMAALGAVAETDGWRGAPGMSGLVGPLAAGLEIAGGQRVTGLERLGDGWWLARDGDRTGPHDGVIVAIPAPQAAALTGLDLAPVEMTPVWTLLGRWPDGPPAILDPDVIGTVVPQGGPGGVVHATAHWSVTHLDEEADRVMDAMCRAVSVPPVDAQVHRWRFARTAVPLGRPYLDAGGGCLLGGDWALGPLSGHAWESGRAMAAALA